MSTPSTLLIGLSGMPRAGKDTVAGLLEKEFEGIGRTNFSEAIAEEYDAVHGTNTRHNEEEKVAHRHGFGELANRRRAENPQYWVERTLNKPRPLIVAGVRSVEEAEGVKKEGGILIRIEISEEVLKKRMGEYYSKPDHYLAEHLLDNYHDWDYVIQNEGTFEQLSEKVHAVAESIRSSLK